MNEFGGATPNEQVLYYDGVMLADHNATLGELHVPADARLSLFVSDNPIIEVRNELKDFLF